MNGMPGAPGQFMGIPGFGSVGAVGGLPGVGGVGAMGSIQGIGGMPGVPGMGGMPNVNEDPGATMGAFLKGMCVFHFEFLWCVVSHSVLTLHRCVLLSVLPLTINSPRRNTMGIKKKPANISLGVVFFTCK
jgi:hypothetical protein